MTYLESTSEVYPYDLGRKENFAAALAPAGMVARSLVGVFLSTLVRVLQIASLPVLANVMRPWLSELLGSSLSWLVPGLATPGVSLFGGKKGARCREGCCGVCLGEHPLSPLSVVERRPSVADGSARP